MLDFGTMEMLFEVGKAPSHAGFAGKHTIRASNRHCCVPYFVSQKAFPGVQNLDCNGYSRTQEGASFVAFAWDLTVGTYGQKASG